MAARSTGGVAFVNLARRDGRGSPVVVVVVVDNDEESRLRFPVAAVVCFLADAHL